MKSKFRLYCYLLPLFFFLIAGLFLKILIDFETTFNSKLAGSFVVILLFLAIFVIYVELKDKIIAIKFEQTNIKIKRFCGIKKPVFINNLEIKGFQNSIVTTKYESYNYIYLIKGNKKVAKISNQYHDNFEELSEEIKKRYIDLGFVYTGFISEIKDIFN